ncbi:hypothetical protein V7S43_003968 [Phytophthora oleae]|uniref:Protein kinase domain-containing protein n=1 Tax=Phytophthora oleae TaxID=2107226 RepID=A0ABD3FWL6_9STRA
MASLYGYLDVGRTLLEHGAALEFSDPSGNTPLMMAAAYKQVKMIKLLLEAGADVNAQACNRETALRFATTANAECVRLLLDGGADIDMAGSNNCSPLQRAVTSGLVDVVTLLLSRGANCNSVDDDGDTVLHEAVLHGHSEIVRLLLEHGASVDVANGMGWTPLILASQRGHTDMATLLIEKDASVDVRTGDDRTALTLAAEEGHLEIVRVLIQKGAQVNVPDSDSQTPLMKAAYRGHEEIVRLLIDNDADVGIRNSIGRTAAEIARLNCRYDVSRILTEREAQSSSKGVNKPTQSKPDWFIANREVRKEQQPFSAGSFGKVYRGWWLSTRVVVKTVTVATEKETRTFHREARIWQKARHPNIVPFFGACDEGSTYFFVCEEAKNGKLLDYLYHAREEGRSLVWRKLLDAALGLHFLHERHVVHSDLKCNQILVSKDGVAMLTDFGLSFLATEQSGDEETVGAIRWKAPEVIRKDKPVTPNAQSDVYSLGMCVVEAVTGEVPWGQVPDPVVKFHVTRKKFLPRPKAFKSDAQWELVEKLCAFEPSERMKLLGAIEVIRGFAEEEKFQERLQMIQQEEHEVADFIADEPPNIVKISAMGTLAKVQSVRTLMRRGEGGGTLIAAA